MSDDPRRDHGSDDELGSQLDEAITLPSRTIIRRASSKGPDYKPRSLAAVQIHVAAGSSRDWSFEVEQLASEGVIHEHSKPAAKVRLSMSRGTTKHETAQ